METIRNCYITKKNRSNIINIIKKNVFSSLQVVVLALVTDLSRLDWHYAE